MKTWKISGVILLVSWLFVAAFIWFRSVDGAGITQTLQLKEITLMIWGIFVVPFVIGYIIWGVVLKRNTHKMEQ